MPATETIGASNFTATATREPTAAFAEDNSSVTAAVAFGWVPTAVGSSEHAVNPIDATAAIAVSFEKVRVICMSDGFLVGRGLGDRVNAPSCAFTRLLRARWDY